MCLASQWRAGATKCWGEPVTQGFVTFTVISGLGWTLDVLTTMLLVQWGAAPFFASICGASAAVLFVYITSRLVLFTQNDLGDSRSFFLYVGWQVVAISAAAALVAWLAFTLEAPLTARITIPNVDALTLSSGVAKALVTPLTLIANFVFLRWLTQTRPKLTAEADLQ